MYSAIVFLPLLGAIIAGLFGRVDDGRIDAWPAMAMTHGACVTDAAMPMTAHHAPAWPLSGRSSSRRSWVALAAGIEASHQGRRSCAGSIPATFVADWALRVDTLTAVMLVVVNRRLLAGPSLFHRLHAAKTRIGRGSSPICRCSPSPC